jgi:hypothetical protein
MGASLRPPRDDGETFLPLALYHAARPHGSIKRKNEQISAKSFNRGAPHHAISRSMNADASSICTAKGDATMFTKLAVAFAIIVTSVTGSLAATKKHHSPNPAWHVYNSHAAYRSFDGRTYRRDSNTIYHQPNLFPSWAS